MVPDPKWLEILKASGWQTSALAFASGIFIALQYYEILPRLPELWFSLTVFVFLIVAMLALASIGDALIKAIKPIAHIQNWFYIRRSREAVKNYIPHMTEKDKEIIGYLLAHNQKMFATTSDAGYASSLIARRIVVMAGQPGQHMDRFKVPFAIPDHVWEVLKEHEDQFPYSPPPQRRGREGPPPWVIPSGF